MLLPSASLLMLVLALAGDKAPDRYPRAELLIEAAEMAKPGTAPLRVLDVRERDKYLEGHIPGAVWVDAPAWGKAFAASPDSASWARRIGDLGIDPDAAVVVYGDDLRESARVWWILRYWGVKDVRLLNGGWQAWTAAGGKVAKEEPKVPPRTVTLTARTERLSTKEELLKALKGSRPQIVDARTEGEHCGTVSTAKRAGAIPGPVHREWSDLVDPKTGRFKSPAELSRLLRESGIDLDRPTVTYCQSGGRASVTAFALELMGAKDVRNYYRSWSEWGNALDTPVDKPKPKK